jgi:hypothetical protein
LGHTARSFYPSETVPAGVVGEIELRAVRQALSIRQFGLTIQKDIKVLTGASGDTVPNLVFDRDRLLLSSEVRTTARCTRTDVPAG